MFLRLLPKLFFLFISFSFFSNNALALQGLPKKIKKRLSCEVLVYKQTCWEPGNRIQPLEILRSTDDVGSLSFVRAMNLEITSKLSLKPLLAETKYPMIEGELWSYAAALCNLREVGSIIMDYMSVTALSGPQLKTHFDQVLDYCCLNVAEEDTASAIAKVEFKNYLIKVLQSGQTDESSLVLKLPDFVDKIAPFFIKIQSLLRSNPDVRQYLLDGIQTFEVSELRDGIEKKSWAKLRRALNYLESEHLEKLDQVSGYFSRYGVDCMELALSNDELSASRVIDFLQDRGLVGAHVDPDQSISIQRSLVTGTLETFKSQGMCGCMPCLKCSYPIRFGRLSSHVRNVLRFPQAEGYKRSSLLSCSLTELLARHELLALSMVLQLGQSPTEFSRFTGRKGQLQFSPVKEKGRVALHRELINLKLPEIEMKLPESGECGFLSRIIDCALCRLLQQSAGQARDGFDFDLDESQIPGKIAIDIPLLSGKCESIDYIICHVQNYPLAQQESPALLIRLNPVSYGPVRQQPLVMVFPLNCVRVHWSAVPELSSEEKTANAKALVSRIEEYESRNKRADWSEPPESRDSGCPLSYLESMTSIDLSQSSTVTWGGAEFFDSQGPLLRTMSNCELSPSANKRFSFAHNGLSPIHEQTGRLRSGAKSQSLPREERPLSCQLRYSGSLKRYSHKSWKASKDHLGEGRYRDEQHLNGGVTKDVRRHMAKELHKLLRRILLQHHMASFAADDIRIYKQEDGKESVRKMLNMMKVDTVELTAATAARHHAKVKKKTLHIEDKDIVSCFEDCYEMAGSRAEMARILAELIKSRRSFDDLDQEFGF